MYDSMLNTAVHRFTRNTKTQYTAASVQTSELLTVSRRLHAVCQGRFIRSYL